MTYLDHQINPGTSCLNGSFIHDSKPRMRDATYFLRCIEEKEIQTIICSMGSAPFSLHTIKAGPDI